MKKLFALSLLLVFAACAASGTIQQFTGQPVEVAATDVVIVRAESAVEDGNKFVDPLIETVTGRLMESATVAAVVNDVDAATIAIDMNITEVRAVGGASRFMFGAMAGRAGITVDVVLTQADTGEELGTLQATGKSSGGTIFAGTTNQAIEQVADQIVEYLGNPAQTDDTESDDTSANAAPLLHSQLGAAL